MKEMLTLGFSRIPILDSAGSTNVVGIVLVKNLITLRPDDRVSVSALVAQEQQRRQQRRAQQLPDSDSSAHTAQVLIGESILRVHQDISIFALIDLFQASKTQLALVYSYDPADPDGLLTGRHLMADIKDLRHFRENVATAALNEAYKEGFVLRSQGEGGFPLQAEIQLLGLTTLEDIVEEMFGEQFVDETVSVPFQTLLPVRIQLT